MIPYDDLVAALQAWRARQGLPVSTTQQPASAPGAATPSNGMHARQGTPPPPTPRSTTRPRMPLPLAPVDTADEPIDSLEVEDSSLIEENHYENEGDDFAMSFGGKTAARGNGHGAHSMATHTGEDETLVGEDVPEATDPARTHNTREDW